MAAVFCRNAKDRSAATWKTQLEPFSGLEFAVSNAAKGIGSAVTQLAKGRAIDSSAPALTHGLDVFHTTMEAKRVLARHWRGAEAAWELAEAAAAKVAAAKQQGIDARAAAAAARASWARAIERFDQVQRLESAWDRVHAALDLFTPDGRLNNRAGAASEIAEGVKDLTGPDWSKVRNFLNDPRSLAFLDRMQDRLKTAEPEPQWREALAWRWWLWHRRQKASDSATELVRAVGRHGTLSEPSRAGYARIAVVLEETFRASSAVECMNSVLRMHQSRHRRMTQPMLDLKRLYWNTHPFRSGPRKDVCPYQRLGLRLPSYDFWELLKSDPTELIQKLSTTGNTE
ncbi:hypothetical protein V5E97_15410 [Singulisphaera sp. Ch08]|uniref:Transposase n=1 Tax=Singulisphaera sp. Ch08 TaxID=3120278 RepID=A0AAU7CQU8_9BACT